MENLTNSTTNAMNIVYVVLGYAFREPLNRVLTKCDSKTFILVVYSSFRIIDEDIKVNILLLYQGSLLHLTS